MSRLLCTFTSLKAKTVLREKVVRGKERVRALSEKLALQDLGLVAGSTKRAKRHVSPAAKLEESQHKLLCFLQMNPQWLK